MTDLKAGLTDEEAEKIARAIYACNPICDQITDLDGVPVGSAFEVPWSSLYGGRPGRMARRRSRPLQHMTHFLPGGEVDYTARPDLIRLFIEHNSHPQNVAAFIAQQVARQVAFENGRVKPERWTAPRMGTTEIG